MAAPATCRKAWAGFGIGLAACAAAIVELIWVTFEPRYPSDFAPNGPLCLVLLPVAIGGAVLSYQARREIRRSPGQFRGAAPANRGLFLAALFVVLLFAYGPVNARSYSVRGRSPNESSAVGSLRTINTGQITYRDTYGGFACSLGDLGGEGGSARGAGLIDAVLASGVKSGYVFAITECSGSAPNSYAVVAVPQNEHTGKHAYCSDQTGAIRYTFVRKGESCQKSGKLLE